MNFRTMRCIPAGSPSISNTGKQSLKITSTLDGVTILPYRTRWVASASLPDASIARVDYLIDGSLAWMEMSAPFVFGGDHNGRNQGYLITTWLSAGAHRFTVRLTDASGHTADDSVTAQVMAPPAPPAKLAGLWTRTLTPADAQRASAPTGQWELLFDAVGAWELDPQGQGVINSTARARVSSMLTRRSTSRQPASTKAALTGARSGKGPGPAPTADCDRIQAALTLVGGAGHGQVGGCFHATGCSRLCRHWHKLGNSGLAWRRSTHNAAAIAVAALDMSPETVPVTTAMSALSMTTRTVLPATERSSVCTFPA